MTDCYHTWRGKEFQELHCTKCGFPFDVWANKITEYLTVQEKSN